MRISKRWIMSCLISVTLWLVFLSMIAQSANSFLPFHPTFVTSVAILESDLPGYVKAFAYFDGTHYFTIMREGYLTTGFIQAFFPMYPMIVAALTQLSRSTESILFSAQLLSLGSLFLFLVFVPSFSQATYSRRVKPTTAQLQFWILGLLLLFPTAFFLRAMYTESLFLLLIALIWINARQRYWWLAGLLTAVASATRIVGIFIVPALLIELLHQTGVLAALITMVKERKQAISRQIITIWIKQNWSTLLAILVGCIGLLAYSGYLWWHFHDPLYFFHVQSEFGGGRQESIVLLPQVAWRYIKILFTVPFDGRYIIYQQEMIAGLVGLIIVLLGWRVVRPSIWFFSLCALLLPTLTGTFSSMPRYVLAAPAMFLIMAYFFTRHRKTGYVWLVVSALLLIFNIIRFVQGYWVA